jgi:hypothetical protein
MRRIVLALLPAVLVCSGALSAPLASQEKPVAPKVLAPNALSEAELKAGWELLFDGVTSTGWRGYKRGKFPDKGWIVDDGALKVCAGGGGGDIITAEQYGEFDLKLEFKVSPKANSGIMYLVTETEKSAWHTGPEYQIWDDMGHNAKPTGMTSSGSCYALYAPPAHKPVKPAGDWNQVRIKIRNGILEHWINGVQLVEADMNSDDWKARVAKSKFNRFAKFSRNKKGHIALQDHGHDVWFRNIKIRDLTPVAGKKEIALFNGRDLSGWSHFLRDGGTKDGTWSIKDGIIVCKGSPAGYIQTEKDYKNFMLRLKWRFDPVTKKAGNSGVLLRKIGEDKVWPKSVEAQLQSGSAGDFWNIGEYRMKTVADRTRGRNTKKTHGNEHTVGEWNEYEIIVKGGNITLLVNGEVLNEAWEVAENAGKICLQSEGVEIHFRDIVLVPIEG